MTPPAPTAPPVEADRVVRLTRAMALGSVIGLIVLGLGWELWWAPTGSGTLALKVLPLLLPLPGTEQRLHQAAVLHRDPGALPDLARQLPPAPPCRALEEGEVRG
jgi:hypothetical protein